MKHNISITMEQTLFREIENIRGREKRSTFIEHLIQTGLRDYKNQKRREELSEKSHKAPIGLLPLAALTERRH